MAIDSLPDITPMNVLKFSFYVMGIGELGFGMAFLYMGLAGSSEILLFGSWFYLGLGIVFIGGGLFTLFTVHFEPEWGGLQTD